MACLLLQHHGKAINSPINLQFFCPHKIKFINTYIMKNCNYTKIGALNVNLESEISYDANFRNF